jgi:phage terminase small subunit
MARSKKSTLSDKQQRFITEYLVDLNGTQAAIRAGYKKKYARQQAAENLAKPYIQVEIQARMNRRSTRTEITADKVLTEFARLGFSDMRRFTEWGPDGVKLKESSELSEDDARCVAEVAQTVTESGGQLKFKLHDKLKALESMARHLKLYPSGDAPPTPAVNVNVTIQEIVQARQKAQEWRQERLKAPQKPQEPSN